LRDLSHGELNGLIEKVLSSSVDTIEKIAPYGRTIVDIWITKGLYDLGRKHKINPYFGPISYQLATTPQPSENSELTIGFGAVQIPTNPRFIGLMGLASMGLVVGLKGLGEIGINGEPPERKIGEDIDFEGISQHVKSIISSHTKEEYRLTDDDPGADNHAFGGYTPDYGNGEQETFFVTDWFSVYEPVTDYLNDISLGEGIGFGENLSVNDVTKKIHETRAQTGYGLGNTLEQSQFFIVRRAVGIAMAKMIWVEVSNERRIRHYPTAPPFPLS